MNQTETETKLFTGKDGMIAVRQQILNDAPEVLRVICIFDFFAHFFTQDERISFTEARKAAGTRSKVIFASESPAIESAPLPDEYLWVPKDELSVKADLYIYNDTVISTNLSEIETPHALLIKHRTYAADMTALFDHLWNLHID